MTEETSDLDQQAIDAILHLLSPSGAMPLDTGSLESQIHDIAFSAKVRRGHPDAMSLGTFLGQGYPDENGRSFPGPSRIDPLADGSFAISFANATMIYPTRIEAERRLWEKLVQLGSI